MRDDRWLAVLTLFAIAVDGLTWAAIARLIKHQTALVPLHYTIYFGPDLTVKSSQMLFLPAAGAFIIIANIIAGTFEDKELWRRMMSTISASLNIILLVIAATLIYVAQLSS